MKIRAGYFIVGAAAVFFATIYASYSLNPVVRFNPTGVPILVDVAPGASESKNPTGDAPAYGWGKAFNVLVLGIDARADEKSRTDAIILAHVEPAKKKATLLSIPRDTKVELEGVGHTKINHAHYLGEGSGDVGGTKAALQAVSALLDCSINYYVKLNFAEFEAIIDEIGGVELNLAHPVKLTFSNRTLTQGVQTVDGETALLLARERESLPDGDFGRQKLQFAIIEAAALKMLARENIAKLPELIPRFEALTETNFTFGDLLSLGLLFNGLKSDQIEYFQVPGHSGTAVDPLIGAELYYWVPDPEGLLELSAIFNLEESGPPVVSEVSEAANPNPQRDDTTPQSWCWR